MAKKVTKKKASKTGGKSKAPSGAMREVVARRKLVKKKKAAYQAGKDRTKELKAAYDGAQKDLDDLIDEVGDGQGRLDF